MWLQMKNRFPNRKSPKFTRKQFILLIVLITTGFIIGYSYNLSKDEVKITNNFLQQDESYREELIDQKERNKELMDEVNHLQEQIRDYEKSFASNQNEYEQMVDEAERIRLLLGQIPAVGEGIKVTLKDGEYNPNTTNPNDYIVHESHIFMVINELRISGAEAISVNGQRLKANSYIRCNGPVITVDGKQYPAPFEIAAVGNSDTLIDSLQMVGGVFDQLLNDQIVVTLEESGKISMPSVNEES